MTAPMTTWRLEQIGREVDGGDLVLPMSMGRDLLVEVKRLRALPVLRTCGDCGWLSSAMERSHPVCDHPDSRDKRTARGRDSAPASWCPQRGGER